MLQFKHTISKGIYFYKYKQALLIFIGLLINIYPKHLEHSDTIQD